MKYTKQPKTLEEQADILIRRGLLADREHLIKILGETSYYRLSYFLYPFKENNGSEQFLENTSLGLIIDRYEFDKQLRLLLFEIAEILEIAIRTNIINSHSLRFGPFGYCDKINFPNMTNIDYYRFMHELSTDIDKKLKKQEYCVKHYKEKYIDEEHIPIWIACELMNFGKVFNMFKGLDNQLQGEISAIYRVNKIVLESWLHTILYTRNLCAHNQTIINRNWSIAPKIPENDSWVIPVRISNTRLFGVISMFQYMLTIISSKSDLKKSILNLFEKHIHVSLEDIGFPENWQESKIWE